MEGKAPRNHGKDMIINAVIIVINYNHDFANNGNENQASSTQLKYDKIQL